MCGPVFGPFRMWPDKSLMHHLDEKHWRNLKGAHGTQFDPRPLLAMFETKQDRVAAWHGLWEELHHKGDVGDASFAAIPKLVRDSPKARRA